jgi:glycosyltransferase involved in cell wall biosynthesis
VGPRAREDYLLAGAFAPYKRGELAIEACRRLGRRLIVVGAGQDERRLRALAGPDVEFVGRLSDEALAALYARVRALLFPGEEDFGIVPVEAMASGCPVIAYGRGGALETVGRDAAAEPLERVEAGGIEPVPGGVLFGSQSADDLARAMRLFERLEFDPGNLAAHAAPFATERFDREFRAAFARHYAAWRGEAPPAPARDPESARLDQPASAR